MKAKYNTTGNSSATNNESQPSYANIQDPAQVRSKGCDSSTTNVMGTRKRTLNCGKCGGDGTISICPTLSQGVSAEDRGSGVPKFADDIVYNTQMVSVSLLYIKLFKL